MDKFFEYQSKKVHYQYFTSDTTNAIIVLIHGLGEHSGRYKNWAQQFNKYNYGVCAIDLPGHGLSYGKKGHIKNYSEFYEVINLFLEQIRLDFPNQPMILYGHSMGGNISANFVLKNNPKIHGLILSSPWLKLAVKPNFFKYSLGKLMYKIYPKFHDHTGLDVNFISRIPEEIERYKTDALVHGRITPALFFPVLSMGRKVIKKAEKFSTPVLAFHGTGDQLTSHKATKKLASKNEKIDFISYENGYHELHHDECRDELFENILDWLSVHVVMR